jgi:alkylation response protein AidB-like acyl-CoA dehydrogenase
MNAKAPFGRDQRPATDFVGRARALGPLLIAAAPGIESSRELPPGVVSALHQAGLFRMLLPRSLGGHEAPLPIYVQAIEELARLDASTAWCVAQTSVCSTISASLRHEVAWDIFGKDPRALLAWGPLGNAGRAIAENDGFRITGAWQFASGSRHAAWLAAHCPVLDPDGTPRMDANGTPLEITAVFPKSCAVISDVWQVMGLKGTGSDSYAVTDLFVPRKLSMTSFGRDLAERQEHGPLYRFTVYQLFGASFASVAIGIAHAMLDSFVELAKHKTPTGKSLLRDNAVVQAQIGLAQSQLSSARVFLHRALAEIWQGAQDGKITIEQRVPLRMACAHATHQAKQVVDTAYHGAGGTAIFESNLFERRFRDMHSLSQQTQAHFAVFEIIGQYFLGLPVHPRFI